MDASMQLHGGKGSGDSGDAWGKPYPGSHQLVAKMPVEKHAMYYNMNHKKRGVAVILNHEHFDLQTLRPRSGTNVDCANLEKSLGDLGFEVKVYHNYKYEKILQVIKGEAKSSHTDVDCFLLAILSHGEMGILYAKDIPYKLQDLWVHFTADKCITLAGKPKLFFIQACQGDKLDSGITMRTELDGGDPHSYKIPTHADFLIAYSTIPGYYSWRNTTNGSWFMQALCTELRLYGKSRDILTLLTFVCQRVALDFESNTPGNSVMHRQKQIPCITTMLTRLLTFTAKE